MNQHQATEEVANALYAFQYFDSVGVMRSFVGPPDSIVLATDTDGVVWSVTVEILAQP